MNQDVKEKWLKVLRSGEYEQGRGQLRSDNKFCCLGVLCEIYRQETGKGRWVVYGQFTDENGNSSFSALPKKVVEWAELPGENPDVRKPAIYRSSGGYCLAQQNDAGATFEQIAQIIEAEL